MECNTNDHADGSTWDLTNFSYVSAVVSPCVFVAELDNEHYYCGITWNFNESMCKYRSGYGPKFVREHTGAQNLFKIVEIDISGSRKSLEDTYRRYVDKKGSERVRSSIHLVDDNEKKNRKKKKEVLSEHVEL
jgi:predicted GIY-YIG superfamily endonuclease